MPPCISSRTPVPKSLPLPELNRSRWQRLLVGTGCFALLSTCSTYTTIKGGESREVLRQTTTAPNDAPSITLRKGYGVPYFLPKAMIHLVVTPIELKEEKKAPKEEKPDVGKTPSPVTVNI